MGRAAGALGLVAVAALVWWLVRDERGSDAPRGRPEHAQSASLESAAEGPAAAAQLEAGESFQPERAAVAAPLVKCVVRLDGTPAPDATLLVLPWTEEIGRLALSYVGIPREEVVAQARRFAAGKDGAVAVDRVLLPAFFAARPAGGQATGLFVTGPAGDTVTIDCPKGLTVRGSVTLADFGPLPDVPIRARRSVSTDYLAFHRRLEPERICGMLFCDEAKTDAAGRFEIADLPAAWIDVEALHPRYSAEATCVELPTDEEVEFVLHPAAVVEGVAVDGVSGAPVGGALVEAFVRPSLYGEDGMGLAMTGAAGAFSVRVRADSGPVTVRVTQPGFSLWFETLPSLAPGETRSLRAELSAEGVLRGRVVSTAGERLANVVVQAWRTDTKDSYLLTRSREDGSFRLGMIDPRFDYIVMADDPDFEDTLAYEARVDQEIELVMKPRGRLEGRLIADTLRFEEARVRAVAELDHGNRLEEAWTAADPETGRFAFERLPPDQYRVDAFAKDFAPACVDFVVVGGEAAAEPLEIRLERGTMLRGSVVDGLAGAPLVDACVRLADVSRIGSVVGGLPVEARTDAFGAFLLGPVAPGSGEVAVLAEKGGYATTVAHVPRGVAAGAAEGRIALLPAATLDVRVRDGAGEAVHAFGALVFGRNQPQVLQMSDGDEHVLFEALCPEAVTLSVWVPQGGVAGGNLHINRRLELQPGTTRREVIALGGGGRVFGRIVLSRPLSLEQMFVVLSRPLEGAGDQVWIDVNTDGTYEFPCLPAGSRLFEVTELDPSSTVQLFRVAEVAAGESLELDFLLAETGFRGRLTDGEGRGIAGGSVETRRHGTKDRAAPYARGASRAEGKYEVLGLEPGEYQVVAEAEGFATRAWEGQRVAEGGAPTPLDLELAPEAVLVVRVLDDAGQALAGARAEAEHLAEGSVILWPAQETAESGEARFARLEAGRYRARASRDGLFPDWTEIPCAVGGTASVNLTLRRLGDLVVKVRGPSGERAAFTPVVLIDLATGRTAAEYLAAGAIATSTGEAATGEDGEVRFLGLPLGRFSAQAPGATRAVEVIAGAEPADVTLAAAP
ncbi:MAG: carboxypeptidase regulatory-like domain-containing protein [Planctomycetes bacterium]|nr:carboxypeptidase regulatory-like domain-containing protein [Planctomycetota bacterium]